MFNLRYQLHILLAEILYYTGCLAAWRFFRTWLFSRDHVCIFGLHRVIPEAGFTQSNALPGMMIKEQTFCRLLDFLTRHFKVIAIEEIERAKKRGPFCTLTFDDGWRDNYTSAYPCLRKYSVPAAIFLVTGFVGSENGFWVERLIAAWRDPATRKKFEAVLAPSKNSEYTPAGVGAQDLTALPAGSAALEAMPQLRGTPKGEGCTAAPSTLLSSLPGRQGAAGKRFVHFDRASSSAASPAKLEKLIESLKRMPSAQRDQLLKGLLPEGAGNSDNRMLAWDEVMEMSQAGVSFGAHTVTHPLLPYEDAATAERELRDSKRSIEHNLHKSVRAFAYPNGDWDARTRRQVATAGYDWAFTTRHGWYRRGSDRYTIPRVLLHEGNITGRNGKFSPAMFTLTTVFGR